MLDPYNSEVVTFLVSAKPSSLPFFTGRRRHSAQRLEADVIGYQITFILSAARVNLELLTFKSVL